MPALPKKKDSFNFLSFLFKFRHWIFEAFGPSTFETGFHPDQLLNHINKELREIERNPTDIFEYIDIVLLGLNGAIRTGARLERIETELRMRGVAYGGHFGPQIARTHDFGSWIESMSATSLLDERSKGGLYTGKHLGRLERRVLDLRGMPVDLEGWLAIVRMGLDGAYRINGNARAVLAALEVKFAKNRLRQWPDWRKVPANQPIEHVREDGVGKQLVETTQALREVLAAAAAGGHPSERIREIEQIVEKSEALIAGTAKADAGPDVPATRARAGGP